MGSIGFGLVNGWWFAGFCGCVSSSVGNAYSHVILSWFLCGIAKSLMFRSATRIDGSSFSSDKVLFSFSFRRASFSIGFRFSVWSSSFCSCPERR